MKISLFPCFPRDRDPPEAGDLHRRVRHRACRPVACIPVVDVFLCLGPDDSTKKSKEPSSEVIRPSARVVTAKGI
jgi:hypothetical protein